MIDSNQITIMFHIDDLMRSRANSDMVTDRSELLDAACGAKDSLKVTRGKHHEHLCMTVDFTINIGVTTTKHDFMKKALVRSAS